MDPTPQGEEDVLLTLNSLNNLFFCFFSALYLEVQIVPFGFPPLVIVIYYYSVIKFNKIK